MQHIVSHNDESSVEKYICQVDDQKDLMSASFSVHQKCKQLTKYGVYDIPCFLSFKNLTLRVNDIRHGTQVYSTILRLINITEGGVSLSKLTYSDLSLLN